MELNDLMKQATGVMSSFSLSGKVAIVTGGAKGLGQAIAFALAAAGADVVIAGKTQANNMVSADEIKKLGRKSIGYEVDVRDEPGLERMVKDVVAQFGKIDILVNSAGIADVKPIAQFDLETWQNILDVNLKGAFLATKQVGKQMLKQKFGKVINVSSLQGFAGRPGDAAYSTSKAALNMMTKSMACEWAKHGICVNAIAPTWCWTEMTAPYLSNKKFFAKLQERIPAGRAGNRDDIFGITVFLASGASDYINGAIIPLDGGAIASDGFPDVLADWE